MNKIFITFHPFVQNLDVDGFAPNLAQCTWPTDPPYRIGTPLPRNCRRW